MRDITRDEFGYPMTGLGQPATPLISTKVTGQQLQPTAAPMMPGRGSPASRGINELTSLRDFSALPMGRTQNPTPLPMSSMTNPNSVGTVGEPGVGVKLNSSPALQIGGTDRYGNPYQPMGPVPRRTPYEVIDRFSKEQAYDYIGRISDDEAKKIDPRGKQGLLDYLVESLKKRKIPKPPRQFEWRQGEQAPQRDWEAILDFQKFVGSKPGPYVEGKGRTINLDVDKALQNPGMVNESFAKNLTVTNLTPELRSSLEAKGFKFKTWDEKLFPNMNKLGDGKLGIIEFGSAVDAMKSLAALKAAGAATNMEGLRDVRNMKFYG